MLHFIESWDRLGLDTWLRCVECSHWGLIVTAELPRWIYVRDYESGMASVRIT
jgi:hypothetical protein